MNARIEPDDDLGDFWSVPPDDLIRRLGSTPQGLSAEDAQQRLSGRLIGLGTPLPGMHAFRLLLAQFSSPIILILVFAALLSLFLGEATDALIILAIVVASGLLGFWQEWRAADALKKLLALVQTTSSVLRDGQPIDVPSQEVAPGDVVLLHAGDIIPGDGRVLHETDLFVAEASLTGETFPVEKGVALVPSEAPLGQRTNCVFLGTSVVSGTARVLVVHTGRDTEFGKISGSLRIRPQDTGFERGIRRFGYLLLAGLLMAPLLTGADLRQMSDEALRQRAGLVAVFGEVEPSQKERIILAMKQSGRIVGYIGDGINDVSALHAADVGISVADAVDVAKDAADFVLLERDPEVLERGVREGRATFANTMEYIFMATSANFGNMVSMAGASLFLTFLPLLPKQVLLVNLLTDLPEMTIATDLVEPEMVERPRRWDIAFIRRFMIVFGAISSMFDFVTFGVLILVLKASEAQLRTGWFVESVVSSALIVLVVRTKRPFYRSRPGRALFIATLVVVGLTLVLPYSPLAGPLGFVALPALFILALGPIVLLYVVTAEAAKAVFYGREAQRDANRQQSPAT